MPVDANGSQTHYVQLVHPCDDTIFHVQVAKTTTVGTFTSAEVNLGSMSQLTRITDAVGCPLRAASVATPFQQIHVREMDSYPDNEGRHVFLPPALQSEMCSERIRILLHQEAWVAVDEMTHYLTMLAGSNQAAHAAPGIAPLVAMDEEIQTSLHEWATRCCSLLLSNTRVISAVLVEDHWLPAYFQSTPFGIAVATNPEGYDWLNVALASIPNVMKVSQVRMLRFFPNDCGFQTVAWLSHMIFQQDWPSTEQHPKAFRPSDATVWRSMFEHELRTNGRHGELMRPSSMRFGGAGGVDVASQLGQLLRERGVPDALVQSRVDVTLDKLGRGKIAQLLRGPQPWKDLKAAANALSPKLQLVYATELQTVIKQRVPDWPPFGSQEDQTCQRFEACCPSHSGTD